MSEYGYYVADRGVPIARWMNLETATLLLQRLLEVFRDKKDLAYEIGREPYRREKADE